MLWGALAVAALPASAQSILQAWERARDSEPSLQSARAGHRAASERTQQAQGALWPQLDASFNSQKNRRESIQDFEGAPELNERYPTRYAQLNLTQPIWRPLNWATLAQAREAEGQAGFQALATEQDLQTRFVVAWFDVMGARDNVAHAIDQAQATRQQMEVMQRGLTLGTHSDVQASDAVARHEQAVADRVAAEAELAAKQALLEQLTGPLPGFAPPVLVPAAGAALTGPLEALEVWVGRAEADNPGVHAAQKALAAAREEVRRQQALHQPTVDLVARRSNNLQGSGTSPGQIGYRSKEDYFGVQMNMPLFTGGTTSAKVREAAAMVAKAEADLEAARRTAISQAHQGWAAVRAAQARMQSTEHLIRAADVALRAATRGEGTGLKTVLDELQARQQLAAARRDQQRARYDRVVAVARLRAATGSLSEEFLAQLESLLDRGAGSSTGRL